MARGVCYWHAKPLLVLGKGAPVDRFRGRELELILGAVDTDTYRFAAVVLDQPLTGTCVVLMRMGPDAIVQQGGFRRSRPGAVGIALVWVLSYEGAASGTCTIGLWSYGLN